MKSSWSIGNVQKPSKKSIQFEYIYKKNTALLIFYLIITDDQSLFLFLSESQDFDGSDGTYRFQRI